MLHIRVQGSNLRGGMDFQNRWGGPPKFWVLLHFYVTISKIFPILTSLRGGRGWGLQGLRGGSYPPCPPPMDTYDCKVNDCNLQAIWENPFVKLKIVFFLLWFESVKFWIWKGIDFDWNPDSRNAVFVEIYLANMATNPHSKKRICYYYDSKFNDFLSVWLNYWTGISEPSSGAP